MKIDLIKPYSKNAKKHPVKQVTQIADSIKRFGFNQPVVVDKDNVVIVGHGRLEAAKILGLEEVPTITVNLTEEEAKAYRLADNKLNESDWDMDLLMQELQTLSGEMIDLTGFDRDLAIGSLPEDDKIPEVPKKAQTKDGDVYQLGDHRIMCGDSRSESDILTLMNGKKAKLIFTSPPYNMAAGMYQNYKDDLKREEYIDFNIEIIDKWKNYLKGFLFWNISYNKNARDEFIEIIHRIIKETGLKFMELIVWNKKHAMPITSKGMMTRQYEDILLTGDEDSIKQDMDMFFCGKNDKGAWFNKKTQKGVTNYWEIGTNKSQIESHLACYPVALPLKGIVLMTSEGDIVADPFIGTGSTLIACEKSNRACYGMELDPKYVDVIVERWCEFTGRNDIIKNNESITWQKTKGEDPQN